MVTRHGIYNNLNESPYRIEINGFTFIFSSAVYQRKFTERIEQSREIISKHIQSKYGIEFHCPALSDIILYQTIEKRGFLILDKDGNIWQKITELSGTVRTYNT